MLICTSGRIKQTQIYLKTISEVLCAVSFSSHPGQSLLPEPQAHSGPTEVFGAPIWERLAKQKPLTSPEIEIDWEILLQAAEDFCRKGLLSCLATGCRITVQAQPPPPREEIKTSMEKLCSIQMLNNRK